jgi:hypothetical protein
MVLQYEIMDYNKIAQYGRPGLLFVEDLPLNPKVPVLQHRKPDFTVLISYNRSGV